jgi:hypothetical protein
MNPTDKQSFGLAGLTVVPASVATTGNFCALQFVTDGQISAIGSDSIKGTITGITFPAGFVLYVPFSSITVTGTALAYHTAP